jgi:predicted amino acid dehydrogenase
LAGEAARVLLVARDEKKLEILRDRLQVHSRSELVVSTKMDILKEAQLILTVTSSIHDVIHPEHLQPGSVVCDVARPRDVSAMVAAVRDDILVIDGGMVDIPGAVNFNFDFGFPAGKAYACMAETIALALEGRFEDYTVGKDITLERVKDITEIAARHGFRMSGFRSFEREVDFNAGSSKSELCFLPVLSSGSKIVYATSGQAVEEAQYGKCPAFGSGR